MEDIDYLIALIKHVKTKASTETGLSSRAIAIAQTRPENRTKTDIYIKHAYFHSEDSLPSLAPLRIPLGSKLVKDDIVRDLVFESTETI
nr:hypothetical protein BaRGS_031501 [Batillaria attramentaria]